MRLTPNRLALPLLAAIAIPSLALAQAKPPANPTAQATLLGQYGDWGAYSATPGGAKVCFALAKPKTSKTEPAGRKRDQAYVFISTRPAENVKHEEQPGWMGDFWKRLDPPRDPFTIARDETPMLFAPGEKLQYSNPGIGMMTYCVTAAIRGAAGMWPAGIRFADQPPSRRFTA